MNHKRWNLLPPIPDQLLLEIPGFSRLTAQLAYNRGLVDAAALETFLAVDERLTADPFLLPDMHPAVARILRALLGGERIAVYGDFDADGITATAVLVLGLSALGADVFPYLPGRVGEGHGLRTRVLDQLRADGVSLVISVDCGITGFAEVAKAMKKGLDIIITDHHVPPEQIPPAVAVVDPQLPGSAYPYPELAGVGVAYKLLQALLINLGRDGEAEGLLDLVALGTVADVMPLLGENRYLVQRGLDAMNAAPRLGIRELMAQAGLTAGNIAAENISWVIAPRINTASRMDHALPSYELLTTDSTERAQELAAWLEEKNGERQRLTRSLVKAAREQVIARGVQPLLMVSDESYPAGIAGLVAGRLSEEFYRPAIIVGIGKRASSGSCRSIPEFNIIEALTTCRDLFSQFGGHAQAAGFVIPTANLPALGERLLEIATRQLEGVDLRPRIDVDAEVSLAELAGDTYQSLQRLAPFGKGNPLPTFVTRRVQVSDCRTMGGNGEHMRCRLSQEGISWDAVGFGMGDNLTADSGPVDIVYNMEIDHWNGRATLRLNILDFAPAE